MYQYKTEQFLPTELSTAWQFFSSPKNLSRITPPEMDFKVLTKLQDDEVYEGMIIDYSVRPLFGIPVHWQTKISKVRSGLIFMDQQLKGPYKVWEHTHTFQEVKDGVLMTDEINYKLPFGFIGKIAHALFVKKKIETIFNFRKSVLDKLFKKNGTGGN